MSTTALRPLLAVSQLLRPRFGVASFASSSRIGLDFTRPRNANPTTTTTTTKVETETADSRDASLHKSQSQSQASSTQSEQKRPSFSETLTPTPSPTVTPLFTRPTPSTTPSTPLVAPSTTPKSAVRPASNPRHLKNAPKVRRYDPEDPILNPNSADEHRRRLITNKSICISHTLHVLSSQNNVHLSFVDRQGRLWETITGGSGKVFKKSNRATHEAAHQAALKTFEKILEYQREQKEINPNWNTQIRVAFKGLAGHGREAVSQAISGPEGEQIRPLIVRIEDRTPIKIGGTRPPKRRRI